MKIVLSKEIRSDFVHLAANLNYFNNTELGHFIREMLEQETLRQRIKRANLSATRSRIQHRLRAKSRKI